MQCICKVDGKIQFNLGYLYYLRKIFHQHIKLFAYFIRWLLCHCYVTLSLLQRPPNISFHPILLLAFVFAFPWLELCSFFQDINQCTFWYYPSSLTSILFSIFSLLLIICPAIYFFPFHNLVMQFLMSI